LGTDRQLHVLRDVHPEGLPLPEDVDFHLILARRRPGIELEQNGHAARLAGPQNHAAQAPRRLLRLAGELEDRRGTAADPRVADDELPGTRVPQVELTAELPRRAN